MKSIKITAALLVATGVFLVSCKKETTATNAIAKSDSSVSTQAKQTTTMNIEGMTCAMGCAKVIENKLAGLEGVEKATVDFDKKTATIEYDAALQTPEKLVETVEAVADGKTYKVANVKSSGDKAMLFQDGKQQEKPKKKKKSAIKTEELKLDNSAVHSPQGQNKVEPVSTQKRNNNLVEKEGKI